MRIGKSLTHRTGRRTQHPARGRLATGRAVGNSALKGENCPTVKLKDTATGESRESWPEGRPEDAMPGESRESWPPESLRRESRPCKIVNEKTPETRVSGVFVLIGGKGLANGSSRRDPGYYL